VIRERWRQWWDSRLRRSDAHLLRQGNIYIVPSRAGLMFALTMVVLLVASINDQLNLGYALTFTLAGSGLVSMHQTHHNLAGLHLQLLPPEDVAAQSAAALDILLSNERHADRLGLALRLRGQANPSWVEVNVPARSQVKLRLMLSAPERGVHALPLIEIRTLYPMGLFTAWSLWRPASALWVYPASESPAPELPPPPVGTLDSAALSTTSAERDGVRPYQVGDPLSLIHWRKSAAALSHGGEWVSRDAQAQAMKGGPCWLSPEAARGCHPAPSAEGVWQRLAAWAQQCEARAQQCPNGQGAYGLMLPGQAPLELGQGPAHLKALRRALAQAGRGNA
jgi:uncharacterized protein (DUF58 family)